MSNHIITEGMSYEINEINDTSKDPVDLTDIINRVENSDYNINQYGEDLISEYLKLSLHYSENFTVKDLRRISNYYGIYKRKLKKDELAEAIAIYETDNDNKLQVEKRKQMWFYISELKNDKFFKKFVLWD